VERQRSISSIGLRGFKEYDKAKPHMVMEITKVETMPRLETGAEQKT